MEKYIMVLIQAVHMHSTRVHTNVFSQLVSKIILSYHSQLKMSGQNRLLRGSPTLLYALVDSEHNKNLYTDFKSSVRKLTPLLKPVKQASAFMKQIFTKHIILGINLILEESRIRILLKNPNDDNTVGYNFSKVSKLTIRGSIEFLNCVVETHEIERSHQSVKHNISCGHWSISFESPTMQRHEYGRS